VAPATLSWYLKRRTIRKRDDRFFFHSNVNLDERTVCATWMFSLFQCHDLTSLGATLAIDLQVARELGGQRLQSDVVEEGLPRASEAGADGGRAAESRTDV